MACGLRDEFLPPLTSFVHELRESIDFSDPITPVVSVPELTYAKCPVPWSAKPASVTTIVARGVDPAVLAEIWRTDDDKPFIAMQAAEQTFEYLGHIGGRLAPKHKQRMQDLMCRSGLSNDPAFPSWFPTPPEPVCVEADEQHIARREESTMDAPFGSASTARGSASWGSVDEAAFVPPFPHEQRVYSRKNFDVPLVQPRDLAMRVQPLFRLDDTQRAALGLSCAEAYYVAWAPDSTMPAFRTHIRSACIGGVLIELLEDGPDTENAAQAMPDPGQVSEGMAGSTSSSGTAPAIVDTKAGADSATGRSSRVSFFGIYDVGGDIPGALISTALADTTIFAWLLGAVEGARRLQDRLGADKVAAMASREFDPVALGRSRELLRDFVFTVLDVPALVPHCSTRKENLRKMVERRLQQQLAGTFYDEPESPLMAPGSAEEDESRNDCVVQ